MRDEICSFAKPLIECVAKQPEESMADQELRDKTNKLLGKVKTLSNGKLELRDATNKLRGTYDPKTNETRDPSNRLVARGNMLTTLL